MLIALSRGRQLEPLVLTIAEIAELNASRRCLETARALVERPQIVLTGAAGAQNVTVTEAD